MALTWDLTNIKDWKSVCTHGEGSQAGAVWLDPITYALIVATKMVYLGSITEDNADEFFARLALVEKMSVPLLADENGNPKSITPKMVYDHIGLQTNVADQSRDVFLHNWVEQYMNAKVLEFHREAPVPFPT